MKTIGMLGGMSWESSIEEIEALQHAGRWEKATQAMIEAARHVEAGGADFLIICTNTMHKMADEVEREIGIPLLHIADATAGAIKTKGLSKIGLLGTRFTMEGDFYRGRLVDRYGLEVLIPEAQAREIVHRVIYDELVLGQVKSVSREAYKQIIEELVAAGAQGIILGCTEIGLLVKEEDSNVPLFDTTYIHAMSAVEYAVK